jgi:hypothetical protein
MQKANLKSGCPESQATPVVRQTPPVAVISSTKPGHQRRVSVGHGLAQGCGSVRRTSPGIPIKFFLSVDNLDITLVFILFVFSGDLFNQANNGSPEFRVLDGHVGLREFKSVRRGEEIRDVG